MEIFEVPEDLGLFQSQLYERHLELLHTYECLLKRIFNAEVCTWGQRCQEMEPVVRHMQACRSHSKCNLPSNCWTLRAKMKVWSDCTDENCPVCFELKEWQLSMTTEKRQLLIDLLKEDENDWLFHVNGTNSESISTQYERTAYNKSESVIDYFRQLATRKWDMKREKMRTQLIKRSLQRIGNLLISTGQSNGTTVGQETNNREDN